MEQHHRIARAEPLYKRCRGQADDRGRFREGQAGRARRFHRTEQGGAFIERDALDEIEIYVMPDLLGGGRPLFPPTGFGRGLR
jgi:hypothetical protein